MTAPDELERVWRVVEAIPAINDLSAQYQNDIAEAILSERAELLAIVERMRGALERIADERSPFDHTGEPLHVRISKDLSRRINEARAALTTGEAPNAGERG